VTDGRHQAVEREVILTNSAGLHLRPAKGFAEAARRFRSEVAVIKDGEKSDGRSVLSLLSLNAAHGSRLTVCCRGRDAEEACSELTEYLSNLPELHGEAPYTETGAHERFPEAVWPEGQPQGRPEGQPQGRPAERPQGRPGARSAGGR